MNTQSQKSISLDTVIRFLEALIIANTNGKVLHDQIPVGGIQVDALPLKLMLALLKSGHADFLLLSDDQLKNWWGAVYAHACGSIDFFRGKKEEYDLRLSAYEKLTVEERKLLGVKMPLRSKFFDDFEFLFSENASEKQTV